MRLVLILFHFCRFLTLTSLKCSQLLPPHRPLSFCPPICIKITKGKIAQTARSPVPSQVPGVTVQDSRLPFLRSTVLININLIQGTTGHTCECFYDELLSDVLRREVSTLSTHLAINRRHWKSMQSLLLYETKLFASIYVWIGTHNLQERIRSVIHTASRVKTLLKLWTVVWSVKHRGWGNNACMLPGLGWIKGKLCGS